ncbi:MAG TPA: pyridoxal phosphate-dependent aminotransferase, partial [Xanthomonadales bacterium]|nr:pyridoxal phosphate-dependent aminotransferase [Xanthomonadales bacterium]
MRGPLIPPFYAGVIGKLATARRHAGLETITMHFGQPTLGAPRAAIDVAHRVLDTDAQGYYESAALVARLSRHYREAYGVQVDPGQILLTCGASAGLVAAFSAFFRAGDSIALVVPGYPAYRNTLRALGMVPQEIRCESEAGFRPSASMLEKLDPAPAGFVLTSPANPTGAMLDKAALAAIVTVCRERGIRLISDEIYHGITFDREAVCALELDPDVVLINSFSKFYRMPGWRLGWMVAPLEAAERISAYLINMFLTPPTLAQHAALQAMDQHKELVDAVHTYRSNRARLIEGLAGIGITKLAPPDGAFYLYADMGHITRDS